MTPSKTTFGLPPDTPSPALHVTTPPGSAGVLAGFSPGNAGVPAGSIYCPADEDVGAPSDITAPPGSAGVPVGSDRGVGFHELGLGDYSLSLLQSTTDTDWLSYAAFGLNPHQSTIH